MFEGKDKADRAVIAVEKEIHEDVHIENAAETVHVEGGKDTKSAV